MSLFTETNINIGDFEIKSFKNLSLNQGVAEHHDLKIVCRSSSIEKPGDELGANSKSFIGEKIQLQIKSVNNSFQLENLLFYGIVTKIKLIRAIHSNSGDEVIIYAKSPTILTDDGVNFFSLTNKSLENIVSNVIKNYDQSLLKSKIKPQLRNTLAYSVQYNESSFNYLKRLASQYGEWFYYNGSYLIFGLQEEKEVELNFKKDLKEFDISLQPLPNNFTFKSNNYLNNDVIDVDSKDLISSQNGFNGFVNNASSDIFNNNTIIMHQPFVDNGLQQRIDILAETQVNSVALNQVVLNGRSDNPGIYVGSIIYSKENFEGKFRVIKVSHTCNEHGSYENKFEAVSAEIDAYVYTNIKAYPKSEPQLAVITENHDPESMGRVKVQFPWQEKIGETTPWTRVISLHAGSGKGFYILPEVGEEVLVGFEEGNAERPYIMGSLYNANAKPPSEASSSNNDMTILQTRSGCKFILNDSSGSILIKDKAGSYIFLDGEGTISIQAKKDVILGGKNFYQDLKESIFAESPEIYLKGNSKVDLSSDSDVNIRSRKTTITSTEESYIQGAKVNINADTTLKVSGTAMTEIKGGQIKMN